jgi:hypothetical protein
MAPFFPLKGIDQANVEFRELLHKGLRWILRQNELGLDMVNGRHRVIWRSAMRKTTGGEQDRAIDDSTMGYSLARFHQKIMELFSQVVTTCLEKGLRDGN